MTSQPNAVLIQQASGDHKALLSLSLPVHLAYCQRHDFDYWPIFGRTDPSRHVAWEKVPLIQKAMAAGYEYIVWLDADCLIVKDTDLREACPENGIGLTRHEFTGWDNPPMYDHWNTGAVYVHHTFDTYAFLEAWNLQEDEGHGCPEQHALNLLTGIGKTPPIWKDGPVRLLGHEWNSTVPHFEAPNPVVKAWHGYGGTADRLEAMRAAIGTQQVQTATDLRERHWRKLLQTGREAPHVLKELAQIRIAKGDYPEALELLSECVSFDPKNADAWRRLGAVQARMGQDDASGESLRRAVSLAPRLALAQNNYAYWLLKQGHWQEGFRALDWAYVVGQRTARYVTPQWDGNPIPGKTLFVYAEQGYGDTIMLVRLLKTLRERYADLRVILEVQPPLVALLRDCPYADVVIGRDPDLDLPYAFDAHIGLLTLAERLGMEPDTVTGEPYIWQHDTPERIAAPLQTDKPKIGVCWQGNAAHPHDALRSLPKAQFDTIFSDELLEQCHVVSLTQGEDSFGGLHDFTDTAAVIANLDLVITVDTAIAHLAGAMGKPVWILLSVGSDWRWLREREDSPLYASARLFRQARFNDWAGVLANVSTHLKAWITLQKAEGTSPLVSHWFTPQQIQELAVGAEALPEDSNLVCMLTTTGVCKRKGLSPHSACPAGQCYQGIEPGMCMTVHDTDRQPDEGAQAENARKKTRKKDK